ncbi:MAG: ABC transporter permease [Acidobacteria bacterium]|nr:ABC transporter permease [Acidobacteriota bacterium]
MDLTTTENGLKHIAVPADQAIAEGQPHHTVSHPLPDQPLITIEPSKSWVSLDLKDVWAYRELLYFLTWRDVKVRYKQTLLGATWAIIQPFFTMLIFTFFFGQLAGIDQRVDVPYPVFAYAGLLPWTFFSNAINNSGNSLVGSANLITKVYFPRMIIPGATVVAGLLDFAIASLILFALMIYYHVAVTWNLLMLPLLVVLISLLALGVGMWLSALNVKYRDIRYVLPFLTQLWMFLSPIIYPTTMVPDKWRFLLAFNPLTGIIQAFRACMLGQRFDWTTLAISTAITLVMLIYSAHAFRRMEKSFADIV